MPFLSVIIPTYHRNDLLALCLDRLSPDFQKRPRESFEVIVTDDGTQHSAEKLIKSSYPWVKWVEGPHKGPAANRNNGARLANADWLVFTDDDCLPSENWLEIYQGSITQFPQQAAFEGAIYCDNEKELEKEFAECPVNKTGNNFWSANIAVRKDLFWQTGGFDEGYFLAAQEDQQLKIDIEKFSPIMFLPRSVVYHPVRFTTLLNSIRRIPKQAKNFGRYAAKNREYLEYADLVSFYKEQLGFHFRHLVSNMRDLRIKSTLISLAWLLYGIQMGAYYYRKFGKLF